MKRMFTKSFFTRACCRTGLLLIALAGLWLLAGVTAASAQGTGWQIQSVSPTFNGVAGRVLWVKPGVTDVNGNYTGDMASVWSLDANGHVTAQGPTYGPFPGATAAEIDTAPDGTTRLKWQTDGTYNKSGVYTGDEVSIWTLDGTGKKTAQGPVYGPYLGWTNEEVQVAPDNTTRMLWRYTGSYTGSNYAGDKVTIWTLNSSGTATSQDDLWTLFRLACQLFTDCQRQHSSPALESSGNDYQRCLRRRSGDGVDAECRWHRDRARTHLRTVSRMAERGIGSRS